MTRQRPPAAPLAGVPPAGVPLAGVLPAGVLPAGVPLGGVPLGGVPLQWGGFTPVPVQQSHPTAVGEGPQP